MTIAECIYQGATADTLGMSAVEFASRRRTLDAFLAQWGGGSFEPDYLAWLDVTNAAQPPMPPLAQMGASAIKAATQYAASGFAKVEAAEHDRRLEVCKGCPDLSAGRCAQCGCYMSLKAWLPKQRCPVGRW